MDIDLLPLQSQFEPYPTLKGYIRGITSVRTVAAVTAKTVPTRNSVQVSALVAPRDTITKKIGRSRKCVNVGTW